MTEPAKHPGLWRRLAALFYDSAALFSVLFVASALVVLPAQAVLGMDEISDQPLFQAYLGLIVFVFFGWFWTHGGQTLGLRAWHMRMVRTDGSKPTWLDALKRFAVSLALWLPFHLVLVQLGVKPTLAALFAMAPFAIGILWIPVDRQKMAWHDRLSGTRPELSQD